MQQNPQSAEQKGSLGNGRRYLHIACPIKGQYSEAPGNSYVSTMENNLIKNQAKDLNKHFSKEDTQMANSKKQRSLSLIIQQIQNQEIMASHTLGWLLLKREKITRVGENVEKLKPLWTAGGKIK